MLGLVLLRQHEIEDQTNRSIGTAKAAYTPMGTSIEAKEG